MENQDLEKLQNIATGLESKIAIQKAKNANIKSTLNDLTMTRDKELQELARLKQVGIDLESKINQKQEAIRTQEDGKAMETFLLDLENSIFK